MISIIVPVYNAEKYLRRCVDSILCQTYSDIQVILINDGSTDSSLDICRKYEKDDPRITVIDGKNEGASAARNKGLAEANGEYIGFVDSDDVIAPNYYETLISFLASQYVDVVDSYPVIFYDDRILHNYISASCHNAEIKCTVHNKKEMLKQFWDYNYFQWNVYTKLFKKKCLEGIRFDGNNGEDTKFILDIIDKEASFSLINYSGYFYFKGNEASVTSRFSAKTLDIFSFYEKFYQIYLDYDMHDMADIVQAQIAKLRLNYASRLKFARFVKADSLFNGLYADIKANKSLVQANKRLGKLYKVNYGLYCKFPLLMSVINRTLGGGLDIARWIKTNKHKREEQRDIRG